MTRGWGDALRGWRIARRAWIIVPVVVVIAGLRIGAARSAAQAEREKAQSWKQSPDPPGWDGKLDFRASPDGNRLWILRPGANPWAGILDRTTRNVFEVPGTWANVEGRACWSPDGKRLVAIEEQPAPSQTPPSAFTAPPARSAIPTRRLVLVEPDAQHVKPITDWDLGGGPTCLRWGADGTWVAYDLLNYDTTLDPHCVCTLELGKDVTRVTVGALAGIAQPVVGQRMVFRGPPTSRGHRLYAVRGRMREEVVPDLEAVASGVSRDGRNIAAVCRQRPEGFPTRLSGLMFGRPEDLPPIAPEMSLMVGPIEGPQWTVAAKGWYRPVPPQWSSDGRQLLIVQSATRTDRSDTGYDTSPFMAVVTLEGPTVEEVPLRVAVPGDVTCLQWGRLGEILFVDRGTIYSFDLAKRVQRQVFPFPDELPGKEE